MEGGDEGVEVAHNAFEHLLTEVDEVHFVDSQHNVPDAEERAEVGVATGLGDDAGACVDKDDGEVGRRPARNHVAGVLLVARRVGYDELALVGGEVAVGHVDGDALFALGLKPVAEECVVYLACSGVAHALRVAFECRELVFVEFLGVEEESANEGGLAIVNGAGGE